MYLALVSFGVVMTDLFITRNEAVMATSNWCLCTLCLILATKALAALVVPDGFEVKQIATNLNPTAMRTSPDGRIFLCEKHGALRVIKNDILLDEPVLTVTSLSTWNERGLIGVAFDPDFETNGWLYIQYTWTDGTQVKARVSRFTLDGDVALEGSETIIFETDPYSTDAGMHNGGSLVIDNNGMMFVFVGDIFDRSLSPELNKSFGKVFRINLDGSIPEDNPYYDSLEGKYRAIWARGLRNPFMVAYDSEHDQTIIGDVGEGTWEELNLNQKGADYGWPFAEGFATSKTNYTQPELAYKHNAGCAISGLAFYHDLEDAEYLFPEEYEGKLFFGDYCFGWIRYIDIYDDIAVRNLTNATIDTYAPVVVKGTAGGLSMTQGLDGSLYFSERGTAWGAFTTNMGVLTGSVYKLFYTGSLAPTIYQPLEQWPPMPAKNVYSLFVGATGQAPLSYTWFQNDLVVVNATNNTLSFRLTAAMNGTTYRVEVSNANGTVSSNEVVIIVSGDNGLQASVWTSQPKYSAGDTIQFNTTIVDPTDDPIRLISWVIELNHQRHTHPFTTFSNVVGGNITIPLIGEVDPVQGYSFSVYVSNSIFSINTKAVISPNLGVLSLTTDPPGLGLLIDDVDTYPIYTTNITGVINMKRTLYAPGAQSIGNDTYVFVAWSDGDTNNEKSVPFSDSFVPLQAKYCAVAYCPDLPLAPITQRPWAPISTQVEITPPIEPPVDAPVDPPADEGRTLVSLSPPFSESIRFTRIMILTLFCFTGFFM